MSEEQGKIEASKETEKVEVKKKMVDISLASIFPARKRETISKVDPE